jgi:hypothetical protein
MEMKYYNTVTKTVTETYIDDATTVAWDDVRVKHFFAPLPVGHRLEYDVDGFPLIVEIPLPTDAELLEQAQEKINAEAQAYLNSTDWYVIRNQETGAAIPVDILTAREEARLSIIKVV